MDQEIWKQIPGWEGFYEASSLGRIKRVAPVKTGRGGIGRILSPSITKYGYRMTWLSKNAQDKKYVRVCRIISLTFFGKPPNGFQVNHKNGQKNDDRVENLEWVSPKENCRHAYNVLGIKKPRGEQHHNSRLTVEIITKAKEMHALGMTHRSIAEKFGVSRPTITAALNGKNWAHLHH